MSDFTTINENAEVLGEFYYEGDNILNFRHQGINYRATISTTSDPKLFFVDLNGSRYPVRIQSNLDLLIEDMGLNILEKKDAGDIYSPMPGLVIEVMVSEGDHVEEGQPLMILEAMKMENIIKSNGNGIVEKIEISQGQTIEKAQILISIKTAE